MAGLGVVTHPGVFQFYKVTHMGAGAQHAARTQTRERTRITALAHHRTVAFQKEALEKHVAMTKALMTSKSVQEFVEKQNDYAKTSFEAYVAELTTVSDLVQGVAKETLAPINDRVNAVGQFIQTNAVR